MGKQHRNLARDKNENVYLFRLGKPRLKLILSGTLVISGLIFLLGFLVAKSLTPEIDWVPTTTRESKGRFKKFTEIRSASTKDLEPAKSRKRKKLKKVIEGSSMVTRMVSRKARLPASGAEKTFEYDQVYSGFPDRAIKTKLVETGTIIRPPHPVGTLALVHPSVARPKSLQTRLSSYLSKMRPRAEAEASALKPKFISQKRSVSNGVRLPSKATRFSTTKTTTKMISPSLQSKRTPTPRNLSHIKIASMPLTVKPSEPKRAGLRPIKARNVVDVHDATTPVQVRYSREGRYYILLGSYAELKDALNQREILRKNAYPAFIRTVDRDAGEKQHQVIVGRYQDLDRATEEAVRLGRMQKIRPRVYKEGEFHSP